VPGSFAQGLGGSNAALQSISRNSRKATALPFSNTTAQGAPRSRRV
jgi:hypothetical protein